MSKTEREEILKRRNAKKRRNEEVYGEDSVLQALKVNDLKRAREMLCREIEAKYEDRVKVDDSDTELHLGACIGYCKIVKVLIRNGADVNAGDKIEFTPLHSAAFCGHADVAKVLLQNGADVNAVSKSKRSALHVAGQYGHVDVAKKSVASERC